MNAKEYLIKKLNFLSEKFEDVKIRYEFRSNTQTHIVEIIPLSFFSENENYIQFEIELENEFEQLFPNENILFVSDDSLTEIIAPDLKLGYDKIIIEDVFDFEFDIKGLENKINAKQLFALAA